MRQNAHEQLPTPRSSGQRSGAAAPKRWAVAAALLILGLGPAAQAAEGDLDPSFGSQGLVRTDVEASFQESGELTAIAIQSDGKIVAAGFTDEGAAVARYRPDDGSLDREFGSAGTGIVRIGLADSARALVVQPDDKIVVAGSVAGSDGGDFAVARFLSTGVPDPEFGGGDGFVTTDFGDEDIANAVALGLNNAIVVVGSSGDSAECDPFSDACVFAVARYNADGSPDTSFDVDGRLTTQFGDDGGLEVSQATGVVVQPDGRIVVAGSFAVFDSGAFDFALARYNADGSLDDSFGGDGKVTTGFADDSSDTARALVLQPDGKLVVAGSSTSSDIPFIGSVFALARYAGNGEADETFGPDGNGRTTTDFPDGLAGLANALVLQPGGKLIVAGTAPTGIIEEPADFALVRYQPGGSPDTTFGRDVNGDGVADGIAFVNFGAGSEADARALALQSDGKIVAAGAANSGSEDDFDNDFALARVESSVVPANLTCQGRPPTVFGTPSDDIILVGTPGADVIHGLEGNDTIIAQSGDDIVCGGPGDDLVFGGPGGDAIEGGDGIDQLVGDDQFAPAGGPDTLRGGEGDDRLFGFGGNDVLEGDAGTDELVGGVGDDVLNGGLGDDRVFGEEGGDTLAGDAGNDTLVGDDLSAGTGGPDVLRGGEGVDSLFGAAGDDQLFGDAGTDDLNGGPGDDVGSGGSGADRVSGGGGADTLSGDAGDDTLDGDDPFAPIGGPDVLRGGEGDDGLFGAAGDDQLFGDAGRDELDGGPGNDRLDGGPGDDGKLFGASGDDVIRGGPGRFEDRLVGGAGRDVLRGGPGDDRLFGGPGRDRLLGEAGNDVMNGQGGSDSGSGGSGRRDRCFSLAPRDACDIIGVGSPPNPPTAISRPSPSPGSLPSSPESPVCSFPQCGA
jgi:uncharacterized delta-60 repeat protein